MVPFALQNTISRTLFGPKKFCTKNFKRASFIIQLVSQKMLSVYSVQADIFKCLE